MEEIAKAKHAVTSVVPGVKSVDFKFEYREMAMSVEELMPFFVVQMIEEAKEKHANLIHTIRRDKFKIDEDTITFYVVGEVIARNCNESLGKIFGSMISDAFGYNFKVNFENHQAAYESAEKERSVADAFKAPSYTPGDFDRPIAPGGALSSGKAKTGKTAKGAAGQKKESTAK